MAGMISELSVNADAMKRAAEKGYPTATDLADWIVVKLEKPFREAHQITGRIVAKAAETGIALHRLPLADMRDRAHRRGRVQRAVGRPFGEKPGEFRWHRAQKRARASEEMAAQAGKGEILTSPCFSGLLCLHPCWRMVPKSLSSGLTRGWEPVFG